MTALIDLLTQFHILPHLPDCLATGEQCYLVGGAPRDFLLERTTRDFDFATPGDPTRLAKEFAIRLGGRWFMMDRARKQSRVVLKTSEATFTYDFAPFRSNGLDADLRLRDFTVNALAVDLSRSADPGVIYDPFDAHHDLKHSILRACSGAVFEDDPLRVLRGIRLASSLNMEFDETTARLMRDAAAGLVRVSAERVRSELAQIFTGDRFLVALQQMESLGVMSVVFCSPGQGESFVDGIRRACLVAARLDAYGSALPGVFNDAADDSEMSAAAAIRMAAFLSGGHLLERNPLLLKQLRFSKKSESLIRTLAEMNSAQADELISLSATGRGRALWTSQLGPEPLLSLLYLLCLVDDPESLLATARSFADDYLKHVCNGRVPDLVDGSWIGLQLGVKQGQLIGRYLQKLRQAEIEGRVVSLDDAHKFLKSLNKKMIDKKNDPP